MPEAEEAQRAGDPLLYIHGTHRRRRGEPSRPGGHEWEVLGGDIRANGQQQQPAGHTEGGATSLARPQPQASIRRHG